MIEVIVQPWEVVVCVDGVKKKMKKDVWARIQATYLEVEKAHGEAVAKAWYYEALLSS